MQDELVRLQAEQSRTIVFVSHDLDEAMRIGDRSASCRTAMSSRSVRRTRSS
jgi:glycine betaine/proline transport system ATP-binding protein